MNENDGVRAVSQLVKNLDKPMRWEDRPCYKCGRPARYPVGLVAGTMLEKYGAICDACTSASNAEAAEAAVAQVDPNSILRGCGIPELEDWYLCTRDWPEGVDCALGLYPLSRKWADWLSQRMKAQIICCHGLPSAAVSAGSPALKRFSGHSMSVHTQFRYSSHILPTCSVVKVVPCSSKRRTPSWV